MATTMSRRWTCAHASHYCNTFICCSGSDQDEDAFVIERRRNRLHVDTVRAQLSALLSRPIFPKGFSFKYPTSTGQLPSGTDIASSNSRSAVETMKAAIEDMKLAKQQRNKRKRNM